MTETELFEEVRKLSKLFAFFLYHTYDSRRSGSGFLDLVLVKPPRVIFAELKSERGRMTPEQQRLFDLLSQCPGVEVYLWRPRDLEEIAKTLRGE